MYLVFILLMFTSYVALCSNMDDPPKSALKLLCKSSFIIFSVLTRICIDFAYNADYGVYYLNNIYDYSINFSLKDVLREPLVKLFYQASYLTFNDKMKAVHSIYWINFALITIIYIKISELRLVFYKKIMLFTIFYFLFTYTLLRNGIPYLLVFLFFYWLNNANIIKKNNIIIASLIHVTTLIPVFVIFLTKIKTRHIKYLVTVVSLIILISVFGFNFSFDLIIEKFKAYAFVNHKRNLFHVIWFLMLLGIFTFSFFENKKIAFTKLHIGLFLVYVIFNILNPVMGYRISIYYLMFYFSMNISNKLILKNRDLLNYLSLILVVMLYFGLFSTHTF